MRRGSGRRQLGGLLGASDPSRNGPVPVPSRAPRPVRPVMDALWQYESMLRSIRGLCAGLDLQLLLRIAFVDPREPNYRRDPDLVPVFNVLGDPTCGDLTEQVEARLLWICSAAIACSHNPYGYGQGGPVPLEPVLLSSSETHLQFSRLLTFGGLRSWERLPAGRGFVTVGSYTPLQGVAPKWPSQDDANAIDSSLRLHTMGARALDEVLTALGARAAQAPVRPVAAPFQDIPPPTPAVVPIGTAGETMEDTEVAGTVGVDRTDEADRVPGDALHNGTAEGTADEVLDDGGDAGDADAVTDGDIAAAEALLRGLL